MCRFVYSGVCRITKGHSPLCFRYSSPGSNRPGSRGRQRTRSVPASSPPTRGAGAAAGVAGAGARGGRARGRAHWRTSRPAPSRPEPSERPLLLLQPLAMGQGPAGAAAGLLGLGRGAVLGYRIAPAGGGHASTRGRSSREEAGIRTGAGVATAAAPVRAAASRPAQQGATWRNRARLRALIRLEHNYSCPL